MFFLDDGDLAVLTPEGVQLTSFDGRRVHRHLQHILWDPIMRKRRLQALHAQGNLEQPRAVRDTMLAASGRNPAGFFSTKWISLPKSSGNSIPSKLFPAAPVGMRRWLESS